MNTTILFVGAVSLISFGFIYKYESYLACGLTLMWISFSLLT